MLLFPRAGARAIGPCCSRLDPASGGVDVLGPQVVLARFPGIWAYHPGQSNVDGDNGGALPLEKVSLAVHGNQGNQTALTG